MTYFSRLTDIVTCNITQILADEADPKSALQAIIGEMDEGLAGAKRSVTTANSNEQRLKMELVEHQSQIDYWMQQAKAELSSGHESEARVALIRKREIENVVAGLQQQYEAAVTTREHLTTTLRALEGRIAEAKRKLETYETGDVAESPADSPSSSASVDTANDGRSEIDAELEALKRELDTA